MSKLLKDVFKPVYRTGQYLFRSGRWLSLGLTLFILGWGQARILAGQPSPTHVSDNHLYGQRAPESGNQATINGRTVSLPWQLRSGRLGVADYSVETELGLELLNAPMAGIQPVRWFSDPQQTPLNLNAWWEGGYRFLDVTDLAQQQRWRFEVIGSTLQLTLPVGQVQAIRRGRQDWGDRIVVDLASPTAWAIREGVGEFTLTLAAALPDPPLPETLAAAGNLLEELTVARSDRQTILRGAFAETARPVVTTLPSPNRLIIDIREDDLRPLTIQWAQGLWQRQQYISVGGRPFPVYWLEITPQTPGLTLRPVWSDPTTLVGISPLATTAQRWQAAAAINAGFFNRNNKFPLGAIRREGMWLSSPILGRGAIAWDDNGQFFIDRLTLNQTVTTARGQSFPLQAVNSGYIQAGIGLYTPAWGPAYTPISDGEIIVSVSGQQVIAQQPGGSANSSSVLIPANGYLLTLRSLASAAPAFPPGEQLTLSAQTQPIRFNDYPHIASGGPLLLSQGQLVLNTATEGFGDSFASGVAPRSAAGVTAAGHLLLVAAYYSPGDRGPSLTEMAQIMRQLNSLDAVNLDGGGSSSLFLGGRLLNRPARTAARVHNGIGLFMEP